jgi:hypothetical protein
VCYSREYEQCESTTEDGDKTDRRSRVADDFAHRADEAEAKDRLQHAVSLQPVPTLGDHMPSHSLLTVLMPLAMFPLTRLLAMEHTEYKG